MPLAHARGAAVFDIGQPGAQDEGGEPRRGVGLTTIRARTAELGGGCTIESERGRTALAVVFPLRDEEAP